MDRAQNLSGYQIYIGPVFEKGQIRFCHDMQNYMWILLKGGEIGPWISGSLHQYM